MKLYDNNMRPKSDVSFCQESSTLIDRRGPLDGLINLSFDDISR